MLLDWWRPLIEFARRLRAERFPWPVHLDEFEFAGRVDRRGKPAIWTYQHLVSRGFVAVDEEGRPYRFISYRTGPALGRFTECDLRRAGWLAGLPDVVEPITWSRPPGDVGVGRTVHAAGGAAWRDDEPARSMNGPGDDSADGDWYDGDWYDGGWDDGDVGRDGAPARAGGAARRGGGPGRPGGLRLPRRQVGRGHLRLVHDADGDAASRPA